MRAKGHLNNLGNFVGSEKLPGSRETDGAKMSIVARKAATIDFTDELCNYGTQCLH